MRWWKVLGAAAFVGVAATGVAIARAERQRRAYTPDQVRDRLRDRTEQASQAAVAAEGAVDQEVSGATAAGLTGRPGRVRSALLRARGRLRALAARAAARLPRGGGPRE